MVALVITLQPQLFLHECTQLFPGKVYFSRLLKEYAIHHLVVDPREHGCPVRRPRVYDGCVRADWALDMEGFYRLYASTSLDTGVFMTAEQKEVGTGSFGSTLGSVLNMQRQAGKMLRYHWNWCEFIR